MFLITPQTPSSRVTHHQINKKYPKLHILVNNAGVSFMKKEFTSDNVGVIAQVRRNGGIHQGCLIQEPHASSSPGHVSPLLCLQSSA